MDEKIKEAARVTFSSDSMKAYLYLSTTPTAEGETLTNLFTLENIKELVAESGVKAGIDKVLLQSIVIDKLYDREYVIATGSRAVNGRDGYFTYNFKTEVDNRPKLLPDGSVDYHSIDRYEPVAEGQEVAVYTPSVPGHFGYNVKGEILKCEPVHDLPLLKGTGFKISEDNNHYFSELNGKVTIINNELIITNVLDINDDVTPATGYIEFEGDVIIHGNVLAGSRINVGGNLSITGAVENVFIHAGGDIDIKAGMQGGGEGRIECDGNIWAKFFEQSSLYAKGDIHTNSLLNCDVVCEGSLFVSGRHGIIVGGATAAQGNIEATVLGNMAEVKTLVCAGVSNQLMNEISELEKSIREINDKLTKLHQVVDKLNNIEHPTDQERYDTLLDQVTDSMVEYSTNQEALETQLRQKLFLISSYSNAKIIATKYLYPNVIVNINGVHFTNKDTFANVTLKESNGEIQIIDNGI